MKKTAVIDGNYRYHLTRVWDEDLPRLTWVMLNPSTADAETDDATIRRCIGYARRDGYGGIEVVNLFALRSKDPVHLAVHPDPVGPRNPEYIGAAFDRASMVVLAFGAQAFRKVNQLKGLASLQQCVDLAQLTGQPLMCLGTNKDGSPKHPVRLHPDLPFVEWLPEVPQ